MAASQKSNEEKDQFPRKAGMRKRLGVAVIALTLSSRKQPRRALACIERFCIKGQCG